VQNASSWKEVAEVVLTLALLSIESRGTIDPENGHSRKRG
jgi:hypothetical protein